MCLQERYDRIILIKEDEAFCRPLDSQHINLLGSDFKLMGAVLKTCDGLADRSFCHGECGNV